MLHAPVSSDSEATRRCAAVLSEAELQRADTFVTEEGKSHFQQRRAFRRYCGALASQQPLSDIVFEETDKGRPYLPGRPDLWFSFSSSRTGFLGAWSWTHAIGVDLEDQTRDLGAVELARGYFSHAEAEAVEGVADGLTRLKNFNQLWSLKEAALKSIGEGLPYGLDTFEFELVPRWRVVRAPPDHGGPARFTAQPIEETCGCAALVIRSAA